MSGNKAPLTRLLPTPDGDDKEGPARNATICSEDSQLFRMLVGAFSVERAFKTIEVGLQSNVSLRSSGITNFNSLVAELGDEDYDDTYLSVGRENSYQAYVDTEFCGGLPAKDSKTDGKIQDGHPAWNVQRSRRSL